MFIKIITLINSGSIVLVFIDEDSLIKKYNIIIKRFLVLKPLRLTNRLLFSFITYYFIIKIIINYYTEFIFSLRYKVITFNISNF